MRPQGLIQTFKYLNMLGMFSGNPLEERGRDSMSKTWRYECGGQEVVGTTRRMVFDLWVDHHMDEEFCECIDRRFDRPCDLYGFVVDGNVRDNLREIREAVLSDLAEHVDDCYSVRFVTGDGTIAEEVE